MREEYVRKEQVDRELRNEAVHAGDNMFFCSNENGDWTGFKPVVE
jgi:hypothetical protein